jgi:hypothetical protein
MIVKHRKVWLGVNERGQVGVWNRGHVKEKFQGKLISDGFSRIDFSMDWLVKGNITLQTEQMFPLAVPLAQSQIPSNLFFFHVVYIQYTQHLLCCFAYLLIRIHTPKRSR